MTLPFAMAQDEALFRAITALDRAAFNEALALGANPNARDAYNQTPLMYSIRARQLGFTRDLLAAGADVNAKTLSDWTALHYAANDAVNESIIELLLENYADPTHRNADGDSPANLASKIGNNSFITTLTTYETRTRERLLEAITTLNTPLFEAALRSGANVNTNDQFGQTPLMYAVTANQLGMTQRLIASGANINTITTAGWRALHYAARADISDQLTRVLLAAGANPELRNADGDTALTIATREGNRAAAAALTAHRPKPTAQAPAASPRANSTSTTSTRPTTPQPTPAQDDCQNGPWTRDNWTQAVIVTGGDQGLREYWTRTLGQAFRSQAQQSGSSNHYYSVNSMQKAVFIAEVPTPYLCSGGRAVVDIAQVRTCSVQFSDDVMFINERGAYGQTVQIQVTLRNQEFANYNVSLPWGSNPRSTVRCDVERGY
jgi:ankyrin repeat protein